MNPTREELLFGLALTKPLAERSRWLDRECADDPALRQRLDALLAARQQPENLLASHEGGERGPALNAEVGNAPRGEGPTEVTATLLDQTPLTEGPGTVIGRYKLLEQIGEGGFGVVYVAEQQEPVRRQVALKIIKLGMDTRQVAARFEAERQALALMDHPNIAKVFDAGATDSGRPFFVMELVKGIPITSYCDQKKLRTRERLDLFIPVCQAIQHAHQKGIIHRDIKPSNILVTLQEGRPVPKVIDFGIAKATQQRLTEKTLHTQLQQFIGTPAYMSPEQAEMSRLDIDTRSDIYSLGVLLYELLVGKTPFDAKELLAAGLDEIRRTILEKEPARPSTRLSTQQKEKAESRKQKSEVDADLDWIVMKCLEKDRTRRYETTNGLAMDIQRHLNNEPVLARPPSVGYRLQKSFRRNKLVFSAAGVVGVALMLGVVVSSWQAIRANRARRDEAAARVRADGEKGRAEKEAQRAKESELAAQRDVYAGDMNLVQRSLEEGDLGSARRMLGKYRPPLSSFSTLKSELPTDLRGWEWRYLWGLCRSDEQSKLTQQSQGFANLAFSPDGKLLALRQRSGDIELWDWESRRHVGTLTNQGGEFAMGFSPDGKLIASANRDRSTNPVVSLWDVSTREIVRDVPMPFVVASLAFSPDGNLLTTFDYKPVLSLWQLPSGTSVRNFEASRSPIWEMRFPLFSLDGATLVLADCGTIRLIDMQTGAARQIEATTEGNSVTALAISPDGQLLASGHGWSDATIRLWDVATTNLVGSLVGHRAWVTKLVFSPDGRRLYSASADQSIRAWNIKEEQEINRWWGHTAELTGLALTPDGKTLVSCAGDGSVRVWDPEGPHRAPPYVALPIPVAPYGDPFTADSQRLITASLTNPVIIWDVATATEIERIQPLGTNNLSVALSPDERLVAVGGLDGKHRVWDLKSQRLVKELQPHPLPVFGLRFLDHGKSLVSLATIPDREVDVRRWDVASWREVPFGTIDLNICYGLAQSPDQKLFAVTYASKPLTLWGYASGRLEATLGSEGGWSPSFSPDGQLLAAALGGRALVWEIRPRRQLAVLEQYANKLVSVAFSPDGKRLVTGSRMGGDLQSAVVIWDYVAQRGLLSLRSRGKFTGWTEFSPDGNTLLALSWQGFAELWHAPSWAEIEAAEAREGKEAGPH